MAKSSSKSRTSRGRGLDQTSSSDDKPPFSFLGLMQSRGIRETVESLVIAFALAFLVRTFAAEPFVIPTGSMAPSLWGRHQNVTCPICDYPFEIGASSEIKQETNARIGTVYQGTCPQCRFRVCTNKEVGQLAVRERQDLPPTQLALDKAVDISSSNGDRILVSKSAYEFGDPRRWDVFVFHFPGDATKNYIKRLVGLPGERIVIDGGDLFITDLKELRALPPEGNLPGEIARKPPAKVLSMRQPVYDNSYAASEEVVRLMTNQGWPTRWQSTSTDGWKSQDNTHSFQTDGEGESWIQYQHFIPTSDDWNQIIAGDVPPANKIRPQLITDSYAYNSSATHFPSLGPQAFRPGELSSLGLQWVGDLMIEAEFASESDSGTAILELVEGGHRFQCHIDLETGKARLQIVGPSLSGSGGPPNPIPFLDSKNEEHFEPTAETAMKGKGTHKVSFANFDDKLYLWVDGEAISFDVETTYSLLKNTVPTKLDLAPVKIGSKNAKLSASGMQIFRDVYYIASESLNGHYSTQSDYRELDPLSNKVLKIDWTHKSMESRHHEFFSSPDLWPGVFTSDNMEKIPFTLEAFPDDPNEDQFFALGDNSPASRDSRLWEDPPHHGYWVERKLIIGRAMCIYWPIGHAKSIK